MELRPYLRKAQFYETDGMGIIYHGNYIHWMEEARTDLMDQIGWSYRRAVEAGLPTVAECGGFLYLGQSLEGEDGAVHPMAGALPGAGVRRQKLVRFGYAQLTARADSLLLRAGETVPVHEFHYWDSTENGAAFNAQKPATGRSWTCGFAGPALYAAFPHLYFAGRPQLAERFVRAAAAFQSGR